MYVIYRTFVLFILYLEMKHFCLLRTWSTLLTYESDHMMIKIPGQTAMHKTLLDDVKFHLDHFDYSEGTYFLAGWLHSTGKPIVSLRVEALNKFSEETHQFEMRRDVNKFYNL